MAWTSDAGAIGYRLILSLALGLGAHLAATSVALLIFGGGETLESLLYVGSFVVVLPGALVLGGSLARALAERGALGAVATMASSGLLVLLLAARGVYALDGAATIGTPVFLVALAAWAAATAALVRTVTRRPALELPSWITSDDKRLTALPALLLALLLLGFPPSRLLGPDELAAAFALAAVLAGTYGLLLRRTPSRRAGVALDLLAVAALILLANDLQLYADADQFYDITSNLHQNFYLGPTNDVMHGRPMLVDTFSQYGVGLFYFLAAWFSAAEIGYGAMTLLSALLAAAEIALVYGILRLGRASRPLAFAGGAVAGIALFFAGQLPAPTSHPSTGGLRYLMPYLVVATGVASARSPGHPQRWWLVTAAIVGAASVWSVETFAYSAAALAGMAVFRAGLDGSVLHRLPRHILPAAIAVLTAHLGFAAITLALAGELPDWGGYLAFLGSYSVDGISALPIEPWSPGIAICAGYFASCAALVMLAQAAPKVLREEKGALLAIAGVVPFGVVSFAYFIGNSYPDAALSVGLPSYLTAGLWLAVLERRRADAPRTARRVAVGVAAWLIAALGVFAWPTIEDRAADTPLAMALPDSGRRGSLTDEVARMWRSDPLDSRYDAAKGLVRRHFPGDGPVLAAATTENTVTILMETGRVNSFPVSHFLQEGLVMERTWPRVRARIGALRPGDLLVTERQAIDGVYPAPLLDRTLSTLQRRFRFEPVDGDPNGLFVVRLSRLARNGSPRTE